MRHRMRSRHSRHRRHSRHSRHSRHREDKDGLSVLTNPLKERIDFPNNCGPYGTVVAVNQANFVNDITAKLNDTMGATTTTGGAGNISIVPNPFGPTLNVPSASQHYFATAAVLLMQTHGYHTGTEGSMSGDPSDGPVKFALHPGSGFGLRFSCSVVNTKTGLIKLIQT